MTYKGARHGYVFKDDNEPVPDYIQEFQDKLRKNAIAVARKNMPKQQYFNENLNYTPTDDGFKTYSRLAEDNDPTVGKIKFPWDK